MSPVAPLLHLYVTASTPSSSARLIEAVSTPSSTGVQVIVTDPVGESLTLATAAVAALAIVSAVPCASV